MVLTSATTALYAWLAGPAIGAIYGAAGGNAPSHPDIPIVGTLEDPTVGVALVWAGLLVTITGVRGLASLAQTVWLARLQLDVVRDLRVAVYEHLLSVVPSALVSHGKGELGARVAGDVQQIESLINIAIAPLARSLITALALGALLIQLDPLLGALALAGVPPVLWAILRYTRRTREAFRRSYEEQSRIAGNVAETAGMVPLVRAYEAESRSSRAFEAQADRARATALRARRTAALLGPVVSMIGALAVGATLVVAALRVQAGEIPAESYVSFFAALFFLYRPVQALGGAAAFASSGLAALDRVGDLLDMERQADDPPDAVRLPPMREHLELSGVRVAYGDREVLRGVDLRVGRGESVAIVGPSGEGKTTLLLTLLGIVRPTEGEVRIDGQDLSCATCATARAQFAWVPQEPLLFADSVLANIALGEDVPDRPRAEQAARAAGAHALIEALPDGYDTVLPEGGASLSVGQRQRLCIARALYREAPILLLDEPTAALDGAAEAELGETIEGLLGERTVILVSHRDSTIERADRVVVLEEGRVVRQRPGRAAPSLEARP